MLYKIAPCLRNTAPCMEATLWKQCKCRGSWWRPETGLAGQMGPIHSRLSGVTQYDAQCLPCPAHPAPASKAFHKGYLKPQMPERDAHTLVSPFRAEQGTSLETPSRARVWVCDCVCLYVCVTGVFV